MPTQAEIEAAVVEFMTLSFEDERSPYLCIHDSDVQKIMRFVLEAAEQVRVKSDPATTK